MQGGHANFFVINHIQLIDVYDYCVRGASEASAPDNTITYSFLVLSLPYMQQIYLHGQLDSYPIQSFGHFIFLGKLSLFTTLLNSLRSRWNHIQLIDVLDSHVKISTSGGASEASVNEGGVLEGQLLAGKTR
jgi:hypothetical protein